MSRAAVRRVVAAAAVGVGAAAVAAIVWAVWLRKRAVAAVSVPVYGNVSVYLNKVSQTCPLIPYMHSFIHSFIPIPIHQFLKFTH